MRPSALQLASKCRGSWHLIHKQDGHQELSNEFARNGHAFHHLAQAKVMKSEIDKNLVQSKYGLTDEEMDDLSRSLSKIEINLPANAKVQSEVLLRSKRMDIKGTPDLFGVIQEMKHAILIDWKSGWLDVPPPESNLQMIAYAIMLVEIYEVDTVECHLVQPRLTQIKSFVFNKAFLEPFVLEIENIIKESEQPNAPLTTGSWCKDCFGAMRCRAFSGEIRKFTEILFPEKIGFEKDLSVEEALRKALPFVKAFNRISTNVETLAKAYVDIHGPLDCGGGLVYKKTMEARQEIQTDKALPILLSKFPDSIYGALKITKTAIEGLCRKTGVRGAFAKTMKDLEDSGCLQDKPMTKYVFVKQGETDDGPKKLN